MSLALRSIPKPTLDAAGGGGPPTPPMVPDSALERIIKLIPADVVAVYLTALSFGPSGGNRGFAVSLFAVGLLLVPTLLYVDGRLSKQPARAIQYVLRTLAFVAWALTISDPLAPWWSINDWRWIPGLAVLLLPVIGSRVLR